MSTDLVIKCTEQQHKAILSEFEPDTVLGISAGPGSGKTRTIASRIAYILSEQSPHDIRPNEIAVLSLTNRSVNDIRSRLQLVLGPMALQIPVMTFHSFAGKVVGSTCLDYQVLDDDDLKRLAKLVFPERKSLSTLELRTLLKDMRRSTTKVETPSILEMFGEKQIYTHDDLLEECVRLIEDPIKIPKFAESFRVVIVDEFQDIYPAVMDMVLSMSKGRHLTLAGDPNQSIYGFLGASYDTNWEKLVKYRPSHKIVRLNKSFRSTPEVLQFASQILGPNMPEHTSVKDSCQVPSYRLSFTSQAHEHQFIHDEVSRLVDRSNGLIKPSDVAILSYTNREIDTAINYFEKRNTFGHYRLNNSPRWIQSPVSFVMQYVRTLVDPSNNFSLLWSLSNIQGVGESTLRKLALLATANETSVYDYLLESGYPKPKKMEELAQYANLIRESRLNLDQNDPDDIVVTLLELGKKLGLDKMLNIKGLTNDQLSAYRAHFHTIYETLQRAIPLASSNHTVLSYFMENYNSDALVSSSNIKTSNDNEVNFSTIHTAKGLEFPIVFVLSGNNSFKMNKIQRRIVYVGMTRASSLLYFNKLTNQFVEGIDNSTNPNFSTKPPNWTPNTITRLLGDMKRRPAQSVGQVSSKIARAIL
ncbi:hypothetical protein OGAPHI_007347 [Ogataea philodendri]|uniref:DNA 3'-5' helicase n=1 Tax=Ogataea philodendri TaxID=1378263 RepID=A0A9P8NVH9_9ASCO|nr:uncharacterized protein OGAPHI_007347 [Ogataea philodendri]KAH3660142.1 hypothetical protein OGAPHI_007347 [Ogataea philodendri]